MNGRQIQFLEGSRFAYGINPLAGLKDFLKEAVRKCAHDLYCWEAF
jgi:hypothetical protein